MRRLIAKKIPLTNKLLTTLLFNRGWLDKNDCVDNFYVEDGRITVDIICYPDDKTFEKDWELYQEVVPLGTGQLDKSDYYEYETSKLYGMLIPKTISDFVLAEYEVE